MKSLHMKATVRQEPLFRLLAHKINAVSNCISSGNHDWRSRHESDADYLAKNFLPSGSGVDCGTKIDWDLSLRTGGERIVLTASFHHMNDAGMYDGWTSHVITVKPSLMFGFDLSISGKNRNGIKEYLHEIFSHDLHATIESDSDGNLRRVSE